MDFVTAQKKHLGLWLLLLLVALVRWGSLHQYTLEWDEANLLAIAKLGVWPDIIRVTIIRELHPPALALMLSAWIGLLGDSDMWVRNFTGLWGLIGLGVAYALALKITKSRLTAWVTTALCAATPFLVHYSSITTFYSPLFAGVLFSWLALLHCMGLPSDLQTPPLKKRWVIGYGLSTLLSVYLIASGAVILFTQAAYVLWVAHQYRIRRKWQMLGMIALVGFLFLPYVWVLMQPWHLSHTAVLERHPLASWIMFLYAPINFLFLGYDTRDFANLPAVSYLYAYGLLGFALLLPALWHVLKTRVSDQSVPPSRVMLIVSIGILPCILLYAVSLIMGRGLFQFRTVLPAIFSLHLILAIWISSQKNWKAALAILLVLMGVQVLNPHQRPYWPDTGSMLASSVKEAGFQPGDGIVFYPGWMSLVFLRYFDPDRFGLSDYERQFDPARENYFNMTQRMDDRYFMVSGEAVLHRPDVQAAFAEFQNRHHRVWLITQPGDRFFRFLNCQPTYMLIHPDGQFQPAQCRLASK